MNTVTIINIDDLRPFLRQLRQIGIKVRRDGKRPIWRAIQWPYHAIYVDITRTVKRGTAVRLPTYDWSLRLPEISELSDFEYEGLSRWGYGFWGNFQDGVYRWYGGYNG